jgi:hypothetical protein
MSATIAQLEAAIVRLQRLRERLAGEKIGG